MSAKRVAQSARGSGALRFRDCAEGVLRAEQLLRHMTGKADFTRSGRIQNVERCVAAQDGTMVINLGL